MERPWSSHSHQGSLQPSASPHTSNGPQGVAVICPAMPCHGDGGRVVGPCPAMRCAALPCPALPCPALRCAALLPTWCMEMSTTDMPRRKLSVRWWWNSSTEATPVTNVAMVDEYFLRMASGQGGRMGGGESGRQERRERERTRGR